MGRLPNLARDTRGATAVEYGLIIALCVLAMLVAFSALATKSGGLWGDVSTQVINA